MYGSHSVNNETAYIKLFEAKSESESDFQFLSNIQRTFPDVDIRNKDKVIKSFEEFKTVYILQYQHAKSRILCKIKYEDYYRKKSISYECVDTKCSTKVVSLNSIKEHIRSIHLTKSIKEDIKNDDIFKAFRNAECRIPHVTKSEDNVPTELLLLKEKFNELENKCKESHASSS